MRRIDSETIRLKFRDKIYVPATSAIRRRALLTTDFTIISNNCWAGTVYESYGLKKQTPTAGMFIMPEDYLTLAIDLAGALSHEIEFIRPQESKWLKELQDKSNWGSYLIGRIGEIELHMLHYHDEISARNKWEARVKRVNYQKLVFKFNDQNGCTEEHAKRFDSLNLNNKIFFTVRDYPEIQSAIRIQGPRKFDYIRASYEPIGKSRFLNVTEYLNSRLVSTH